MPTLKEKTAGGLMWGALNSGLMQVLNLVVGIGLARLLTPSDYGLMGMIAIFSAIAVTLQDSGFSTALTNLKEPTHRDFNAVFWFSMSMSVSLYVILFFSAPLIAQFFHQPQLVGLSRLTFVAFMFSALGIVPNVLLFRQLKVRQTAIINLTSLFTSGVVALVMAFNGFGYWSLAWNQVIYVGMVALLRFGYVRWMPSLHIDFSPIRSMLSFSYKMLVTSILNICSQNLLTFIFGRLFPVNLVGNYTQAFKWDTMASYFVVNTLSAVAQPVFVETNGNDEQQLRVFRKMMRLTAFLAFPAMLGLAMVGKEFILVLLGTKWLGSVVLLQILCVSGAFLPLYNLYQKLIIARGHSDIYLWCSLGMIVMQLAIVLLFASQGIQTMVTAYSVSMILYLFVWHHFTRRLIAYRWMDALKDIVPFGALTLAVMAVAYVATLPIHNLQLLLGMRIVVAAALYYAVMRLLHVKIMQECLDYLKKKKGK